MTAADHPPIVVLLGGPSAEHDVSIVSGTRHRRGAGATPAIDVAPVLIDLDGRWWWLPADHRARRPPGRPPTTTRRPSAPTARSRSARRSTGSPRADPRRSCSSPSTARSARTAPSRRCSRRPASPTPASGVAASALGMDKALFKRLARGLGLPVVDWREVRAARWAADPTAVLGELEAFAAGTGDAAADDQAGPARLVGRDDARPRRRTSAAGARRGVPVRHARPRRALPAGARDLEVAVIGNDRGPLELYGPGEIVAGHEFYDYVAKYTPACRRRRPAPRSPGADARARSSRSPATRTGRSAPRASPGSTSSSSATRSTCARSTRSRASRRSASSRRCPPRAARLRRRSAGGSWTSRIERHAARIAGRPRAGRPAAVSARWRSEPGRDRPSAAARRPGSVAARPA